MLLLTGPGAPDRMVELLHQALAGRRDFRFLVPTATLARHVSHEAARAGFLIRPQHVQTLFSFLQEVAPELRPLPEGALAMLVTEALGSAAPPGLRQCVQDTLEELASAGRAAADLRTPWLAEVATTVDRRVRQLGWTFRGQLIRNAALRLSRRRRARSYFLAGFFRFSAPELDLIAALGSSRKVTVALPEWPGAETARERLRRLGFRERYVASARAAPRRELVCAPSLAREVEEVARRIAREHAAGLPLRQMGVVVRGREPYVPALETAFRRFGIPAQFYFASPLERDPSVRHTLAAIDALLANWPLDQTLAAVRLAEGIDAAERDRFDFSARPLLPGRGLAALLPVAPPPVAALLAKWQGWSLWATEARSGAEWAELLTAEQPLLAGPLEVAAAVAGPTGQVPLSRFWASARIAIREAVLRLDDGPREAVHILDAVEARHWRLPLVFILGLVEKHFPQSAAADPLLTAPERAALGLPSPAEQRQQERFLFDAACQAASGTLVLSYPRFDSRGLENLPSFFLDEAAAQPLAEPPPVRPKPRQNCQEPSVPRISDPGLDCLSPSAIESFLQCPFQFFAGHILQLADPPPAPADRLDFRQQGELIHAVLQHLGLEADLGACFDRLFDAKAESLRLPAGFRTERLRLEMRRHLLASLPRCLPQPGVRTQSEVAFHLRLPAALPLRGRIDRLDLTASGAQIVDYKYSRQAGKVRQEHDCGWRVQGGLYVLGAEALGYKPCSVQFVGLKEAGQVHGWDSAAELADLRQTATRLAAEVTSAIANGVIAPRPADPSKCRWCDFRDACRVESAPVALGARPGSEA